MKINTSTDYAIRILIYLAENNRIVSSTELSGYISVSQRYLLQVAAKLRDGGLVGVCMGSEGGYCLQKKPEEITLQQVFELIEGTTHLIPSSAQAEEAARMHDTLKHVYYMFQWCWDMLLGEVSIDMMLHRSPAEIQTVLLEMLQRRLNIPRVDIPMA